MERLVVGLVDFAIAICRGTVVRLTAVGDAIVSLGHRIAHRFRRQPPTGVQVFIYFNILCLIHAVQFLGSYFQRARRRMTSQTGEPLCRPIRKLSVFLAGGAPTNRRPGFRYWRLVVDQ